MAKKELKNIRTGALSRGFSLAKLGLQAGTKAAGHAIGNMFSEESPVRKTAYLLEQAGLLTQELGKLKGSVMKAGQMLSVYGEHFLPKEANQILKTLQSDSVPLGWTEMRKNAVRALGKERFELLEISEEALAAASLGQVHLAKVKKTGQELVLKFQYPGVDKAIEGDLKALRNLLTLSQFLPKVPATDELFAEVKFMLKQELDYERERKMLSFFREALKKDDRYVLPTPVEEFSGKKVIAMSYEKGNLVETAASFSQERRNALATAMLDLYFKELFVWKKVQTDPHFGNYAVRPGKELDQLVLFDYGAVREIPDEFLEKYRKMLAGLFFHSREKFEEGARLMGILEPSDPQELKDLFYSLCSAIVEPFAEDKIYNWKENDLPQRVSKITWEIFKKFPLRAPPREVVFLDRKMAGVFTFLSVLGAKINARAILAQHMGANQ